MSNLDRMLRNRWIQLVGIVLIGVISFSLSGAIEGLPIARFLAPQAAVAQRINPDNVWRTVYQNLPDLPLENQYIRKDTGKVDPDNTLVGRFIRYHVYLKGRPPFYRLDWKMTLADYLGVNGVMEESTYPSHDTLRKNPLEGDIAAIDRLNRAQRDALVQALVDAFSPQKEGGR
ncbi:hypothetical protein K9N68_33070 [Kovacikia minuta CCNUW1]|uniref:hypothetical protein n=1 Tax=Kovacikia minuta TaxID=2931930 RepID=UPI001CC97360|nr:hypothetical protein [Kovacikia minuta]UBF26283.1 hypothetical protein K9N68_33070 [Kovacikia minuta CCNUW1]